MSDTSAENNALAAAWRDRAWTTWGEVQGIVEGDLTPLLPMLKSFLDAASAMI